MTRSHDSLPLPAVPDSNISSDARIDADAILLDRRSALRVGIASLLAMAVGGGTSGCAADESRRDSFAFLVKGDVMTLDLNQMSYAVDFRVTYLMREGLFVYDKATGDPIPALAERHEVSTDKKTWTFHLRKDARWSNGDPVTAEDFAFSWRLMLTGESDYGYLLYYIKNAEAFEKAHLDKKPLPNDQLGIHVPDPYTLQVEMENPLPFFPDLLAFPPFYPRHAKSMERFKEADGSYNSIYTRPENVVLNGAYVFDSWDPKTRLVFKKNPHYWDRASVRTPTIEMLVNPDSQSGMIQYKRGRVDWMVDVAPETAVKLKRVSYPDLRVMPAYGTCYLTLNLAERPSALNGKLNPLAELRIRQALSMAIDRRYLVDKITRMGERPALSYVPPGYFDGYVSVPSPALDLEGARRLLVDAGHPNGQGLATMSITYNSEDSTRKAVAEYLKQAWSGIGINVDLNPLERKTYRAAFKEKKHTIGIAAWYGDYLDLTTWTDKYLSRSLNNDTNWGPAEYDQLCDQAKREPDVAKRQELLRQAEALINTQLPIIPLYHYVNVMLYNDRVHGLIPNKKNTFQLKYVSVDPGENGRALTTRPTSGVST